ncbi:alpha/beta hydrolase [Paenactinomyces guangxiensis]|uniref:Alpha/beta hydrolase n=1 Tax=Paenactinomyces guangxiensis TaxID=1490290 RepID=A0A7W1WUJ9_9BACL|nr:alpha/beta hydrolase [Paenactinomyces guangxiensis]MBA4496121.1 alpha/beta hydrolase [Paenactinomyces guangxiensis]MBH8593209.1 alpha/beta hydrolase [Paenactinomyces guangxiensis]
MAIDIQVQQVLNKIYTRMSELNHPPLEQLTPGMSRYYFQEGRKFFARVPVAGVRVEDRRISRTAPDLPIRIYSPDGRGPFPVLVYFHGGGWVLGDLDSSDDICQAIAKRSHCVVISVGYRLAPEHKYPAPVHDAFDAICWAFEHIELLHGDPMRLAVGGESAGANLACAAALKASEIKSPPLFCQLLITPVTHYSFNTKSYRTGGSRNLTRERMIWFWHHYLQDPAQGLEPYASPLLVKNPGNLPPALIATAQYDPLRDEGEAYANLLRKHGVNVTYFCFAGLVHSFVHMAGNVELAKKAFEKITTAFFQMLHMPERRGIPRRSVPSLQR